MIGYRKSQRKYTPGVKYSSYTTDITKYAQINPIEMGFDHKLELVKSPYNNFETNFRNTQKIYSTQLGVVGRQPQFNNFMMSQSAKGGFTK